MVPLIKKAIIKTFKKRISLRQLRLAKRSGKDIKLIIGSGYTLYKGWVATDIETLNIIKGNDWQKYFKKNSIRSIIAEHVFEHLNERDRDNALQNIHEYLCIGGNFRIAVPDGYHPRQDYIDSVKPGGKGEGAMDHKFLYNYHNLPSILKEIGFSVQLLEYFDEYGLFHSAKWHPDEGMVQRSAFNDKRNSYGELVYTSLIIDAIRK